MKLKRWTQKSSKTVMRNSFWAYNVDEFSIENSVDGEYHYVHTPGSTMVIPQTAEGHFLLVRQYRYLNQRESWEFPCGGVKPGLPSILNALKELREETGFSAGKISYLGFFSPFTGAADELCMVYRAQHLIYLPLTPDETEDFEVKEFPGSEIRAMIKNNIIWDGLSLSAFALASELF